MFARTSFPVLCILTLTLICFSTRTVEAQLKMTSICVLVPFGSLVASETDYRTYYNCTSGGPRLLTCSGTDVFDKDAQGCVTPSEYKRKFNQSVGAPGSNLNVGAGGVINLCDFIRSGLVFGDVNNCRGWNICSNKTIRSGTCENPALSKFNVQDGQCDRATNVDCTQVTKDPVLSGKIIVGGPCNKSGAITTGDKCSTFYICNGTYNILNYCPDGMYFDTVDLECVDRVHARNDCDRCDGTDRVWVNEYSTSSCSKTVQCKNGKTVDILTCAVNSYFDERKTACIVGVQPNYRCCNPSLQ